MDTAVLMLCIYFFLAVFLPCRSGHSLLASIAMQDVQSCMLSLEFAVVGSSWSAHLSCWFAKE